MPVPATPSQALAPAPPTAVAAQAGWTDQPVFCIFRVQVRDGRAFGDYLTGSLATIVAAGGRFLAAGAVPQPVEGDWPLRRVIVHQWPNAAAFFAWYEGSPYAPWKQIRQRAADCDVVLVQGIAAAAPAATQPPALALIDLRDLRDRELFGRYAQGHQAGLRAAGGEFLAAGGRFQVLEGTWAPGRVVLQRWPSLAAFRAWYDSAPYRPWREMRWAASQADFAVFEGLSEAQKRDRGMP
ncbi:MAG: DUF1330 domain-containing protein [Rubrivivax sp.]|nr:DUF1330 domain-containing protein [Rubrivivax sp.]